MINPVHARDKKKKEMIHEFAWTIAAWIFNLIVYVALADGEGGSQYLEKLLYASLFILPVHMLYQTIRYLLFFIRNPANETGDTERK